MVVTHLTQVINVLDNMIVSNMSVFCRGLVLISAMLFAVENTASPVDSVPESDDRDTVRQSQKYTDGKAVYNYRCYYCHAYSGDARTVATRSVSTRPLNFRFADSTVYTTERLSSSIMAGRPGTAMPAFGNILTSNELESLVYYIQQGFMAGLEPASGYHTRANGWPNHQQKYAPAYNYVLGTKKVDDIGIAESEDEKEGRKLFLSSCITCHEPWTNDTNDSIWEPIAVSYPRSHSPFREPDAYTGATVFRKHEVNNDVVSGQLAEGKQLYLDNCAFCHSPDKSGKNWIGRFLQPNPRDLGDPVFLNRETIDSLSAKIAIGVPNTSMPRWDKVMSSEDIRKIAQYLIQTGTDKIQKSNE